MKLSIVIPVYRVEATLERCLQSVTGQNYPDFEVILVDDGSPDRCPQLCDDWAERDNRVRVIHKENGGLSDARNAGIDAAQGDFLTFVDSDDFLNVDTYAQVMPLAEDADIVEFPLYWHFGASEQKVLTFGNKVYDDMRRYWLDGRAYAHTYAWNKIYRRRLFDGVRFPKDRVFEDVATLPLLLERATRVVTTDKGLYYYRMNREGITGRAEGRELTMLLESHLPVIDRWYDARYYMHVLNIQLDVCRLTRQAPLLPSLSVSPLAAGLSLKSRCKAVFLNILGIDNLCKLNTTISSTSRS